MESYEPLDGHIFVVEEEFGRLSSVDPSAIAANTVETWMDDSESKKCLLCGDEFTIFKRRHHCRYCGLLLCGNCTNNSMMIGDKIERICDCCAAILLPPSASSSYPGIRKWYKTNSTFIPKIAAFSFISSLLADPNESAHKYAINTLLKLYKCHAPGMIQANVASQLLRHCIKCKCSALASTLDLFVSLYMADPSGCNIDFTEEPFDSIDINTFFSFDSLEMKRAAARFMYLLVFEGRIHVSRVVNLCGLIDYPDKWVAAFVIASIAFRIPRKDIDEVFTQQQKGTNIFENSADIIRHVSNVFSPSSPNTSTAARYYASVILEYLSHFDDCLKTIAEVDSSHIVTTIAQCFPRDEEDDRAEIKIAVFLTSVESQLWTAASQGKLTDDEIRNMFSVILLPLFDIMGTENKCTEPCLLSTLQIKFLEIMRLIGANKDLKVAICSDQMLGILKALSQNKSEVGAEAEKTLKFLFEEK